MAAPIARVAKHIEGELTVVYLYAGLTTRTVTMDPVTKDTTLVSTGTAYVDGNGNPTATWWSH